MTALGTTPLSAIPTSEDDFASQLVRIPKTNTMADTPRNASFHRTLNDTIQKSGPAHVISKEKAAQDDKKLMETCIEMESLLVGKMLKEMRKTVPKTGWMNGGPAEEIFEDMLYDEYAMSLSKNSNLGLAKMLYNQLKRKA